MFASRYASAAIRLTYPAFFGSIVLLLTIIFFFRELYPHFDTQVTPQHAKRWKGWASVERLFIFGDSYSDTGFDYTGRQPCPEFPLGNPAYPLGTAHDQVNWPVYITNDYNKSVIRTCNFARVGSTIDRNLIPHTSDLVHQLRDGLLPLRNDTAWNPDNSLIVTFFGMNDVLLGLEQYDAQEIPWLFDQEFVTFASAIEELYNLNHRNFLLLHSPPVQRTPYGYPAQKPATEAFNARLAAVAATFRAVHPDTTVFEFDTYSFFNTVIDTPASFPETAGYKNTTKHCLKYAGGTKEKGFADESCGAKMEEFLWRDALHTTFPVHQALAAQIVEFLGG